MRRLKLTLEYNGSPFKGWQKQEGLPTVQRTLEDALFKLTGQEVETFVAGRTDAAVHARGQVCHFDIESDLPPYKFRDGLSRYMGPDVAVLEAEEVDDTFHARFSATMRHYEFLIFNRRIPSPTWHKRAVHIREPLDISLMQSSLPPLLGEVDYASFRSSECQSRVTMVFMESLTLEQMDEHLIKVRLSGNHFLHNMVRILVGTLVDVGKGTKKPEDIPLILAAKDRTKAGPTLKPDGLYLTKVDYS